MAAMNVDLNPDRMTIETRTKLREAHLGKGEGKAYRKYFGEHLHRVIAAEKLGRPLIKGEVVHHIDGDKKNNIQQNLMVMTRSEHTRVHQSK